MIAVASSALIVAACNRSSAAPLEKARRWKSIAFAADGTTIIALPDDNSSEAVTISLATGATTNRALPAGASQIPVQSPDGRYIAFSQSSGKDLQQIIIANADLSQQRPLSTSASHDMYPMFAASPTRIYFARAGFNGNYDGITRPGFHEWDIFSADIEGKNVEQLTQEKFYDISVPAISPNGKILILTPFTEEGTRFELYELTAKPMSKRVLTPKILNGLEHPQFGSPVFLPDGKSILFMAASLARDRFSYDYDVYRMDLSDQQVEKLTSEGGYATDLCIGSDGKKAAFLRWTLSANRRPESNEIIVLDLASKSANPLKLAVP